MNFALKKSSGYRTRIFAPAVGARRRTVSSHTERELNGYVTFGSFNNAIKLSDLTVETWAAILKAVPQSRLVLKWLEFDQVGASGILDRFAEHGVNPERIIRQGWADDPYTPYGQA